MVTTATRARPARSGSAAAASSRTSPLAMTGRTWRAARTTVVGTCMAIASWTRLVVRRVRSGRGRCLLRRTVLHSGDIPTRLSTACG